MVEGDDEFSVLVDEAEELSLSLLPNGSQLVRHSIVITIKHEQHLVDILFFIYYHSRNRIEPIHRALSLKRQKN